jgi:riboflavin kinase/FMN adenylyltransferase
LPFTARLADLAPLDFIERVLLQGLGATYVLVGDDFRFGARRAGDYALLDQVGMARGFDVARMNSYEVHNLRVSSSAVRAALDRRPHERRRPADGPPLSHLGPCGARAQTRTVSGFQNHEPALCTLETRRQRYFCRAECMA